MERKDELEARVREAPLSERLDECRKRIGKMCSEGRPPRMCIPAQWDDDDFYISTTLADAQRALDGERETVRCIKADTHSMIDVATNRLKEELDTAQARVRELEAQLAAAQKVKADYDRWLSGGVYFTTAEYKKHVAEHRQQVEALQTQLNLFR